jgi:hypothetical protein
MKNITIGCSKSALSFELQAVITLSLSTGMAAVIEDKIDSSDLAYEILVPDPELIGVPETLPKKKRGKRNHINQDQAWMRRLPRRGNKQRKRGRK